MTLLVPDKDQVNWFRNKRATVYGKQICPMSLAMDERVVQIINWEVDLQTWHTAPFEGPTSRWPWVPYTLMQHARGVANAIERRNNEELAKGNKNG